MATPEAPKAYAVGDYYDMYNDWKTSWANAALAPDTFSAKIYGIMSKVSGVITETIVPSVVNYTPEKVKRLFNEQFSRTAVIFTATSCLHDFSWIYNLGSSSVTVVVLADDTNRNQVALVRDVSMSLLGLHAVKGLLNGWSFIKSPNMSSALGCLYDIASVVHLSQIIHKNPLPKEVKAE